MTDTPSRVGLLAERWNSLSRAMRLALVGGAAIGAYFLAIDPALAQIGRWNARADAKEAELDAFARQAAARAGADSAADLGVSRFGVVASPAEAKDRGPEFNRRIATILEQSKVKRPTTTTREQRLPSNDQLARQMGQDWVVERLISEIEFEGEPEQIAHVLAALEQEPDVATISRLQVRAGAVADADNPRLLKVNLAAETWQLKKKRQGK